MRCALAAITLLLILTGCSPANRSPDAIREDTARATKTAAQDAKAVAQGVEEGLKQKGPININKASVDDLKTLPGIDDAAAHRIADGRPYDDSMQLVKRHIISKSEYDQIASHVTTK
jgi:DNA uptake protein ComE-like DNA-binding protein